MKKLTDRLFWIHLELTQPDVRVGLKIAREESRDCFAIAEAINMESLIKRLEYVRDFFCGVPEHSKEEALERLCEAMAIADVLPDIQVVLPQTPE